MKVKCLNDNDPDLTLNKLYTVIEEYNTHYSLIGDRHYIVVLAPKNWFIDIKLERKLKIESLW